MGLLLIGLARFALDGVGLGWLGFALFWVGSGLPWGLGLP